MQLLNMRNSMHIRMLTKSKKIKNKNNKVNLKGTSFGPIVGMVKKGIMELQIRLENL